MIFVLTLVLTYHKLKPSCYRYDLEKKDSFLSKIDEIEDLWMGHAVNVVKEIDLDENVLQRIRNSPRIY